MMSFPADSFLDSVKTAPPTRKIDIWAKQIASDRLNELGREAVHYSFPLFADPLQPGHWRAASTDRQGGTDEEDDLAHRWRYPRRYSSGVTFPRYRYHTLCRDFLGDDDATLVREIMFYTHPGRSGLFHLLDTAITYNRQEMEFLGLDKALIEVKSGGYSGLVLIFDDLPTIPSPFIRHLESSNFNLPPRADELYRIVVLVDTNVEKLVVDNVLDLRFPDSQNWFLEQFGPLYVRLCKIMERRKVDPTSRFLELLPALLTPHPGGSFFTTCIGKQLINEGVSGIVFPSARANCHVEVQDGVLLKSYGWNFLDYRGWGPGEDYLDDMVGKVLPHSSFYERVNFLKTKTKGR